MLARYPFLPQGSEFIKGILEENGISIEELIDAPWLEDVRIRGRVRLVDSVLQDGGIEEASTIDISTEIGRMTEALSFLHAMLVVCASFDERLLARWIEGEASRADRLLGIDSESFPEISGSYLSDIRADGNGTRDVEFWVPLADFIELCPRISGNYWRLVNRPVRDGWVCLFANGSTENGGSSARSTFT